MEICSEFPIDILGNPLSPANHVRNIGVNFDANFDFKRHINNTVSSCNYYIRDIRRIRKHLTLNSATALANALVSSRLDYCNSSSTPYLNATSKNSNVSKTLFLELSPCHTLPQILSHYSTTPPTPLVTCSLSYPFQNLLTHIQSHPSPTTSLPCQIPSGSYSGQGPEVPTWPIPPLYTSGRAGYGRRTFRFFAPEVWNSHSQPNLLRPLCPNLP